MHKSDRIEAGCTVEDEPYKSLERDAEKSILAGPLRFPPGQLPFSASLKAPVPLTHDAVTAPVMFGPPNITGEFVASAYVPVGTQNGAFRVGEFVDCPNKDNNGGHFFYFDASDSDSTYGATQTVQPASLRLILCIKS